MSSRTSRGQSAMEYLMTYGWAILVIIIVISVLFYMGVMNPKSAAVNSCIFAPGFSCYTIRLAEGSGLLSLDLGQATGGAISVTGIGCSGGTTLASRTTLTNPVYVPSGEHRFVVGGDSGNLLNCTIENGAPIPPADAQLGERYRGKICVDYTTLSDGQSHSTCSDVSTTFEGSGSMSFSGRGCGPRCADGSACSESSQCLSGSCSEGGSGLTGCTWCPGQMHGEGSCQSDPSCMFIELCDRMNPAGCACMETQEECEGGGSGSGIDTSADCENVGGACYCKGGDLGGLELCVLPERCPDGSEPAEIGTCSDLNHRDVMFYCSACGAGGSISCSVCGDGDCGVNEDKCNCPDDCGLPMGVSTERRGSTCGNGVCEYTHGDSCSYDIEENGDNCPEDCCASSEPAGYGTCQACTSDCPTGYPCDDNSNCASGTCDGDRCAPPPTPTPTPTPTPGPETPCLDNITYCCTIDQQGTYSLGSDIGASGTCITVNSGASGSTLDCGGHLMSGPGSGNAGTYGVYVNGASGVAVNDCNVNSFSYGIYFLESSGGSIIGNTLSNNWDGIHLDGSSGNTITNNDASGNHRGIMLMDSSDSNGVSTNIANSNGNYGIAVSSSTGNDLSRNTANSNGEHGIMLDASGGNTVEGNGLGSNTIDGVNLENSAGNTVDGNTVTGSDDGITLSHSVGNTFTDNLLSGQSRYDFLCGDGDTNIDGGGNTCDTQSGCSVGVGGWLASCPPPPCLIGNVIQHCGCTIDALGTYTIPEAGLSMASDEGACITIESTATGATLDCQHRTITGSGASSSGIGIDLNHASGVNVVNCDVTRFNQGIYLWDSTYNHLTNNVANLNNYAGIRLHSSHYNDLTGNTAATNLYDIGCYDGNENNDLGNTCNSQQDCGGWLHTCPST